MASSVEAFIRYKDASGTVKYGQIPRANLSQEIKGQEVDVLSGDPFDGLKRTGEKSVVTEVLCPLEKAPMIYGIGLNYKQHAHEAKLNIPDHPVVFTKPPGALAGPYDNISIHPDCQSHLDWEGELTVVIGKDCKNATLDNALDYVLGYTAGNDISARNFQLPEVSGGQHGYAKSFDGFAPIGPAIVSATAIPDPHTLNYVTRVNGVEKQRTGTDDMIWTVKQIIVHLSRGTTLRPGTVILTGTPSGVGFFMKPPEFLKNGDVVEVDVEGIGKLGNEMNFE